MVLTLLDLLAIVGVILVSFILMLICLFVYICIKERYQKPKMMKVEALISELKNKIDKLDEKIVDIAYVDSDLKTKLSLETFKPLFDIKQGLAPSSCKSIEDAESGVNELKELFDQLDAATEELDIKEPDTGDLMIIKEQPFQKNQITVPLDIEFVTKHESGGCAFLGEFDFADFVVLTDLNFELTKSMVDHALYQWCFDASLQSFKQIDGKWYGHVGFVDDDAPNAGTKVTLNLEVDVNLVNCDG